MSTIKFFVIMVSVISLFVSTLEAKKKPAAKSALELKCDSFADPHDKSVCLQAQADELRQKAEATRKAALAAEPKSMKMVRQREERNQKKNSGTLRREAWAIANSGLSGCPEGSVWVSPSAVGTTAGGFWGGLARSFVHSRMFVVNNSKETVDIVQVKGGRGGPVVRNLCPGGTLTLSHDMDIGGYDIVGYSAVAHDPKGKVGVSYSPEIPLQACWSSYSCQSEFTAHWEISLH